ncbi:hypothetical protein JDS87_29635 [Bacillus cereus]|uniref:hypothetical protein n=1 Tax=Bacillus cereus TaxID=1396 RepID=UPI0018F2D947|nr:hypothetical protein [Bacillus cereus]MBJ8055931.1 hypothetical protein [Bacillus cereus]
MADDVPLWHYDITVEDIPALVTSPAEFFKGSGIEVNYETHRVTFVGSEGEVRASACCYKSGSESICHWHAQ